jgi:hypothetical protein
MKGMLRPKGSLKGISNALTDAIWTQNSAIAEEIFIVQD